MKKRQRSFEQKERQAKQKSEDRVVKKVKQLTEAAALGGLRSVANIFQVLPKDGNDDKQPMAANVASETESESKVVRGNVDEDSAGGVRESADADKAAVQSQKAASQPSAGQQSAKPKGQGAVKWNTQWLKGDRVHWVQLSDGDTLATCAWCIEYLKKQDKTLISSWVTTGCATRKEIALSSHESSTDHVAAVSARIDAITKLASKQDQSVFAAYEGNFMILYHDLKNRVSSVRCALLHITMIYRSLIQSFLANNNWLDALVVHVSKYSPLTTVQNTTTAIFSGYWLWPAISYTLGRNRLTYVV